MLGKHLRLYPKCTIREMWFNIETRLALNVNKMTLNNSGISNNLIIDDLADQFGTTTQVKVLY